MHMKPVESPPTPTGKTHSHLDEVNMIGKLADLKIEHERLNLMLASLVELLDEKDIINKKELQTKMSELDQ